MILTKHRSRPVYSLFPATPPRRGTKGRSLVAAFTLLTGLACTPQADAVVTFQFNYTDPAGTGFNDPNHPEYKAALVDAAQITGSYFANTATIVMTVTSNNDPNSSKLASAGSDVIPTNGSTAGFFPSVVQAKILSDGATDLNGSADDGVVDVNLGSNFQYTDGSIDVGKIDFRGTMIHELTHALGFASNFQQNPDTTSPGVYSTFDSFLTDASGNPLIDKTTFVFNASMLPTLTGGNNSLMATSSPTGEYFSGPNAKDYYNNSPVPIFSPNPYQGGSSGSHVDDNTMATKLYLMAAAAEGAGPGTNPLMGVTMTRVYSSGEIGILQDLGYTLSPAYSSFFKNEYTLSNGVYYLAFPNGNVFGYYSFFNDPRYIYHQDLGFEYTFDAKDGKQGIFLYDFKSQHFFYTSPTFSFPYLYDYTLKAVLYYYPDPSNPGRYNTNGVRYFYNFATGAIITQ